MSTNLSPWYGFDPLPHEARRAARAISRTQLGGQVRVAKMATDADVADAAGEIYTEQTGRAMTRVIRVAQGQRALEQLVPEAAGRLALLADDHALTMGDIMSDLRRDLRRR